MIPRTVSILHFAGPSSLHNDCIASFKRFATLTRIIIFITEVALETVNVYNLILFEYSKPILLRCLLLYEFVLRRS